MRDERRSKRRHDRGIFSLRAGVPIALIFIAVLTAIFSSAVFMIFVLERDSKNQIFSAKESALWASFQLQSELYRFRIELDRVADNQRLGKDGLSRPMDILMSRLPILKQGQIGQQIQNYPEARHLIQQIESQLLEIDPLIQEIESGQFSSIHPAKRKLVNLDSLVNRFVVAVNQGHMENMVTERQVLSDDFQLLKILIITFLVGLVILLAQQLYVRRKMRQSYRVAEKLRQRAEEANQAKSDFLAIMSHEIRTPINGVIGLSGLLQEMELGSRQKYLAKTISSSAEALMGIINDILDISKIEAGKLSLDPAEFNLKKTVENALELLVPRAAEKSIGLVYRIDPSLPEYLIGDASRIRQILLNLAGNAIKFTKKGAVTVEVGWEDITQIQEGEQVRLRFSIRDTGIGIREENRSRLFQKFSQVDVSDSRNFGGTGLGLVISKRLCNLMAGEIGVNSQIGEGSEFWFILPLKTGIAGQENSSENPEFDLDVLLLEQHPLLREVMERVVRDLGCRLRPAETVNECLDGPRPDLVISDTASLGENDIMNQIRNWHGQGAMTIASHSIPSFERTDPVIDRVTQLPCGSLTLARAIRKLLDEGPAPRKTPAPTIDKPEQETSSGFGGKHILVAEDSASNREVAKLLLEKAGHKVSVAVNGLEALKASQALDFDLILMDAQMPEMDGLTATREIRAGETEGQHVPIIAMTANVMDSFKPKCLQAGMDDFVTKPVSGKTLQAIVSRWTNRPLGGDLNRTEPEGSDSNLIELIEQLGNNSVVELLDSTCQDASDLIQQIGRHCKQKDHASLEATVHKLKSSTAAFSLTRLSRTAASIESLCQTEKFDEAIRKADGLSELLARDRQDAENILATRQAG